MQFQVSNQVGSPSSMPVAMGAVLQFVYTQDSNRTAPQEGWAYSLFKDPKQIEIAARIENGARVWVWRLQSKSNTVSRDAVATL